MGNFWANRVAQQQAPAAPPQPAPAPASNAPWWLPKQAPQVPQQVVQQPQVPQQGVPDENGQVPIGYLLHQEGYQYTSDKAQSARDTERCPECDSGNYLKPKGVPNAMKQCFECGYNPRFAHSTAGASGIGQKNVEAPRPARVQTLSEGNFNPKVIVGRVA